MTCKTWPTKYICGYLIALLMLFYFVEYRPFMPFMGTIQFKYYGMPLLWIGLILYMQFQLPHHHGHSKLRFRGTVLAWAFNCGVVWIVVNLIAGVVIGFGKSPYSHSINGILLNVLSVGAALVGREYIRSYLVNTTRKRYLTYGMVAIVVLMTFTELNWMRLTAISDLKSFTVYSAEFILPGIAQNVLATWLVAYGGVWASVFYLAMVKGFEWLMPVLPNLDWLFKGVIGMAVPLACYGMISGNYLKLTKKMKTYRETEENIWQWGATALFSILLIWFVVGVFPVYPSAIATGSMQPMIDPGDVVLVRKMTSQADIEALEVGEVIQFKRDHLLINHRIIEVIDDEDTGLKLYRTKGDNNSAIDTRLVKMEEIKGVITGVIPKIGIPTIILKSQKTDLLDEIEF